MNFQHLFIGYYILEKKENFKSIKQKQMLRRAKHIELGKYNHPDESLKIKTKPT